MGEPGAAGLEIVFDPELRFHLPPPRRRGSVTVPADPSATLGHLVQSIGVPLTEVGVLLLDGAPAAASRRAVGRRLAVPAAPRPQPAPQPLRFVLDVHLGSLARRLRLLGLDVAYRTDAGDDELAELALAESRVLLTRDRELLKRRVLGEPVPRLGAFVRGTEVEAQTADVLGRFAPVLAPFTRCLACGGPLVPAAKAALLDVLPAGTRRSYDDFVRCARCGRPFWRGAHSRGLAAAVERATALLAGGGADGGDPPG
ncbi:Mut7-C RNAse domain-containing protein [Georgenia sp. SYP-B2076]|uniref:Mut7-C RNAse domain-containing protein n=1 Tax=Georgenia sp. SYP-B2076 TaxID=2495881 RepID=UPI000F8F2A65|nr:Mut7-C RNAse domain-containing protein [Georgenia sp. SYP-B2076]